MELTIPDERLPRDPKQRAEVLDLYFGELLASADSIPEAWKIFLSRPTTMDYYVDPLLMVGLHWWADTYGPVSVAEIPFVKHNTPHFQLSFQDAWTLEAWSEWLVSSEACPPVATLLHVDDHDDFMSPRVVTKDNKWWDLITGESVDLHKPLSVRAAIRSGAIGIGSFMAPILHLSPNLCIRHLCATEYSAKRQGLYRACPTLHKDTLLSPGDYRLGVTVQSDNNRNNRFCHPYLVTDDLREWLHNIPPGPVLLHIDMDYFNNRFNGSSDWALSRSRHDPPIDKIVERIEAIFQALLDAEVSNRIVNITVSLSPGFFPADLWSSSIKALVLNTMRLYN
jgi:hypothetical protein